MKVGCWVAKLMRKTKNTYLGLSPLPSNSDHEDYFMFSREFQAKPSFATITGKGAIPNTYHIHNISHCNNHLVSTKIQQKELRVRHIQNA